MAAIWKYPLLITDEQVLTVPSGATPLAVGEQYGTLCLWALVDPRNKPVAQTVRIYGTGHPIEHDDGSEESYVGTVQMGPLVWHCFWVTFP
jgi:hypothetical protein